MSEVKNVLVVGASGGSGYATVKALVAQGCKVTALSRKASQVFSGNVNAIDGSALDRGVLKKAIKGQDVVIITLGISENPFRVRFLGPKNTDMDIRSHGTGLVVDVMKELGVRRLIVQTTYGSGPSKGKLKMVDQLFFDLLLKPQIADTEIQDEIVRSSDLDWTITQPVHLHDDEKDGEAFISDVGEVQEWKVSRGLVGEINSKLSLDDNYIGKTVAVSGKL